MVEHQTFNLVVAGSSPAGPIDLVDQSEKKEISKMLTKDFIIDDNVWCDGYEILEPPILLPEAHSHIRSAATVLIQCQNCGQRMLVREILNNEFTNAFKKTVNDGSYSFGDVPLDMECCSESHNTPCYTLAIVRFWVRSTEGFSRHENWEIVLPNGLRFLKKDEGVMKPAILKNKIERLKIASDRVLILKELAETIQLSKIDLNEAHLKIKLTGLNPTDTERIKLAVKDCLLEIARQDMKVIKDIAGELVGGQ